MEHRDSAFRNTRVQIDGDDFVGCEFENAIFVYGGGEVSFRECNFIGAVRWELVGNLALGLEVLRGYAHASGPRGVKLMVDGISAILRKPSKVTTFTVG